MNCDNQQVIYCEDGEDRVYCDVCDNLRIERFYENISNPELIIIIFVKGNN